jgi:hypothetical protein
LSIFNREIGPAAICVLFAETSLTEMSPEQTFSGMS